jgi:chemotaxis protein methyltransferase CheR
VASAMEREQRMTDREFRMFAELLRRHCGIHFAPEARFLLENRVARRVRELELASFAAYHYLIRSSSPTTGELARLVDELTTNETYFFRERSQLSALIEEIVAERLLERRSLGGGPVTIWSAGCSSGEEPYSVVMLGLEAGLSPRVDLRVYASDVSRRMLRKARQGVYQESSFRETEDGLRSRYFEEKDGLWRISDEIKKQVDFIHLNLMDRSKMALLGAVDVILCRNVIIYFDTESKRRVIEAFGEKLRAGGHLLLGHSESLIGLSSAFELRHLKSALVYRKPLPGMGSGNPYHEAARAAVGSGPPDGNE